MVEEAVGNNQFPTFDAESKSAKIPNSHYGGGGVGNDWFPTFDVESKFANIPNSHYGGRGLAMTNFQLWMLSLNLLKSQSPIMVGVGVGDDQFPTLDAEFKFAKIPKSYDGEVGGGLVMTNFQLLMLSSNLLKSQSPITGGLAMTNLQHLMLSLNLLKSQSPIMVGVGVGDDQFPTFDSEFRFAKILKSHYGWGEGLVSDDQFPTFDAESEFAKI